LGIYGVRDGREELFLELQGFDADTFFLYCDDVDLSWRVRLAAIRSFTNARLWYFMTNG